jgi:hypothetical protein
LVFFIKVFYDGHSPPPFHAEYGDDTALIDRRSLSVFAGELPPRALGMVMEWALLHREELMANWDRARSQQELQKIAPLD